MNTFPNHSPSMRVKFIAANTVTLLAIAVVLLRGQGIGPLDPPDAPADGVYRTLDEIYDVLQSAETRTPISTVPIIITEPGSYYLTGNLVASPMGFPNAAIRINVPNVTLDLNGYTLSSTAESDGVAIFTVATAVRVQNGFIRGNTTLSIDPEARTWNFTKAGFQYGIFGATHIENVSVHGCRAIGIENQRDPATVIGCSISECGGRAIHLWKPGLVRDCQLSRNGSGVFASSAVVTNCHAFQNEKDGFLAAVVANCSTIENGQFGVNAPVAVACYAKGNQDGLIGEVISQCSAVDNLNNGLRSRGETATSLSSASGSGISDITAQSRLGNFPAP
jgi:hypothetical protein